MWASSPTIIFNVFVHINGLQGFQGQSPWSFAGGKGGRIETPPRDFATFVPAKVGLPGRAFNIIKNYFSILHRIFSEDSNGKKMPRIIITLEEKTVLTTHIKEMFFDV